MSTTTDSTALTERRVPPRPVDDSGPVWATEVFPWRFDGDAWTRSFVRPFGPFEVGVGQRWERHNDGYRSVFEPPVMFYGQQEFAPEALRDLQSDLAQAGDLMQAIVDGPNAVEQLLAGWDAAKQFERGCPSWCTDHQDADALNPARHVGHLFVEVADAIGVDHASHLAVYPTVCADGRQFVDVLTADPCGDIVGNLSPQEARALGEALVRASEMVLDASEPVLDAPASRMVCFVTGGRTGDDVE